jgi:hypothetical protein
MAGGEDEPQKVVVERVVACSGPSVRRSVVLLSASYLARLAGPGRCHLDGITAFGLTLILAIAVLVLQLSR